jgi:ABC-type nitrate/sulfonate/bicarbonate transport system substrate-binding protein
MLALVGACSSGSTKASGSTEASTAPSIPFTIAYQTSVLDYLPFYIGVQHGFFTSQGLKVTLLNAGESGYLAALFAGQAQASLGNISAAMTATKQGKQVQAIAAVSYNYGTNCVISTAVAKQKGITAASPLSAKVTAMKGEQMLAPSTGSGAYDELVYLLNSNGINPKTQKITFVNDSASQVAAFRAGQVQAMCAGEPYMLQLVDEGKAIYVAQFSAGQVPAAKDFLQATVLTTPSDISAHKDYYVRLDRALNNILAYMHAPANFDQVLTYAEQFLPTIDKTDIKSLLKTKVTSGLPTTVAITPPLFNASESFTNDFNPLVGNPPFTYTYQQMIDNSVAIAAGS